MDEQLIKRMIGDSRTTRRDFIRGAVTSGLALSAASGLWTQAHAATPTAGGHMRVGMNDGNTNDSLDPTTFVGSVQVCSSRAARDSLVEIGNDNKLSPAIAESWEASADAKSWRFTLRKGVEFSDGKSLTVDDVINSINVHRGESSTSGAKGIFEQVVDVRADGAGVVVVDLAAANADFPWVLTDYHVAVLPTKDGKADVLSPIGTGCYKIVEFVPGVRAAFERNPNAWQTGSAGFVDSAEILVLWDDTARQNALVAGQVDVINRPALKTAAMLKAAPGIRIVDVVSNRFYAHPMFMDAAPFDDNNFRMALKHALPRQEFLDKILYGYGQIGNDSPIGPLMQFYDPNIEQNVYDLDKARYYMKQAGLDGGLTIDFSTADTAYGGAVDAAVLFQQSYAQIGVNLNIIREPADGYWSNVWLKKPFVAAYWNSRPTADMILSTAFMSDAVWNETHMKNPHLDELVATARGELDEAKRQAMYSEIQSILSKEGGELIPAFGSETAAVRDTVGIADQLGGGFEMDGGFFLKRWWMNG